MTPKGPSQGGTNHAWANTGDTTATMMAVLVDGA